MESYPEQHEYFIQMRCQAQPDQYGRLSKSESKLEYFNKLVEFLIDDKYSRKTRIRNQDDYLFFKTKDNLSEPLMRKVTRAVDILFYLTLDDRYIVEKSYMILDELTHRAKDEGAKQIIDYLEYNPHIKDDLQENTYVGVNGHYREFAKRWEYKLDALYYVPSAIGCLPVLDELVRDKDYESLVSYCVKYRSRSYELIENI